MQKFETLIHKRTDYCTRFGPSDIGREITVCGWVQRRRVLGGLIFVDLRDRTGILQLNFDAARDQELFVAAERER